MIDTLFIGQNIISLEHTSSTNAHAIQLLAGTPPEGTLVQAMLQSRGRGQAGNSWHSEAGKNLLLSLILYPRFLDVKELFYLSKMTSVAIQKCLSELLPWQEVRIKWPNDILINRRKVAGILIENQLDHQGLKACVIGIGLNLNQQSFPVAIREKACSVRQFAGSDFDLQAVTARLCQKLEGAYLKLRQGPKEILDQQYLDHLYGYQEYVNVRVGGTLYRRMLVGVGASGKLALEWNNQLRYFDIKELEFIVS